jgi:hypothetical protein
VGARQDVDLHGVDAEARRVQPGDRHVGGGVAQFAAALVAVDHLALDPVEWPSMAAASRGRPSDSACADRGRGDLGPARSAEKRRDGDAEAHRRPEAGEVGGRAGAALAEAEVLAHDDMGEAEPSAITSRAKSSGVRPASAVEGSS